MFFVSSFKASAEGFSIDVACEPSEQQIDENLGYFDLKNNPGKEEILMIKVTNLKEQPIDLAVHFYSGSTATTGTIVYEEMEGTSDDSHNLEKQVKLDRQTLTLQPLETQTIEATLTYPEDFKGLLLGGFRFSEENKGKRKTGIQQSFEIVKGLVIHGSEEYAEAELIVEQVAETAFQEESVIALSIKNPIGYAVKNASLNLSLIDATSEETTFEQTYNAIEIAPFSTLPFQFSVEKPLKRGHTYRLVGELQAGNYHLPIEDEFTTSRNLQPNMIKVKEKKAVFHYNYLGIGCLAFLSIVFYGSII